MNKYFTQLFVCLAILGIANCELLGQTIPVELKTPDKEDLAETIAFPEKITINYNGNTATVSDAPEGVQIVKNGAKVNINSSIEGVEITLSGNTTNGSLTINSSNKIKLSFNGVSIANNDGPAINIQSSKRTYIVLGSSTTNSLSDGLAYSDINSTGKAALFSEGELIFSGNGKLSVSGNKSHAICSDDYIVIRNGSLSIPKSVKDGIHSNDNILVEGGIISITSTDDGFNCEKGFININNGNITLVSTGDKAAAIKAELGVTITGGTITADVKGKGSKGIRGKSNVTINGGSIKINTFGDALLENSDITSSAGVSSNGKVKISGSNTKLTITSTGSAGKGISCDTDLEITNGIINITTNGDQFYGGQSTNNQPQYGYYGRGGGRGGYGGLSSSAKGIKVEGNITINGGKVTSTTEGNGSEAIESKKNLTINGGTVIAKANDDGINASEIIINGGNVYSYSYNNDGIDSNGPVTITGGFTVTSAPRGGMEGGIDCDNYTLKITGGTLVSLGGKGSRPSESASTQPTIICSGNVNNHICIKSSDNKDVIVFKLPMEYTESFIFTSPDLKTGKEYTIYTGGSISEGTEQFGKYTGSTYSNGSELGKVTITSTVNYAGSASGNQGFRGGRGYYR